MEDDVLIKRLSKHPKLKARFTRYLDIIENTKGDVGLADLAEESIIEESRQMNQETLQMWAERQNAQQGKQVEERHRNVSKAGKKNCVGTAHSERSPLKSDSIE